MTPYHSMNLYTATTVFVHMRSLYLAGKAAAFAWKGCRAL